MTLFYTLLAGFAGAVIACSYLPVHGLLAVILGLCVHIVTGFYLSGLLVAYLDIDHATQPGLAFLFALTAKNLLGGIMRLSELFRRDPPTPWRPR